MSEPLGLEVVEDTERAQTLLHPARLALLDALTEPASAATLARLLDQPRQRVNYHLRELEEARLVELVEERKRGSVTERIYRRSGRTYAISDKVLGMLEPNPDALPDRVSAEYQIALASRTVRELAALDSGAQEANQRLATFAFDVEVHFATPGDRAAFAEELTQAVAQLVRRYHHPDSDGARAFRLHAGCYPRPRD